MSSAPARPDLRGAFAGPVAALASPLGRLSLGVVDPHHPGVAEAIAGLLVRSIGDARASRGGHLPDWLVDDVERNYISPAKVRSLWAPTGHRFGLLRGGELVATVHVARAHDTIFTIDRVRINVSARAHPGFKPERYHHVVNLSVKHELRRARLATAMLDGVVAHFRGLFDGEGLWVRADPPWHAGLAGLGFAHDPSLDVFLPAEAERTAGLPHAAFNALHACDCAPPAPARPEALAGRARAMREQKLQYVSFSRAFEPARPRAPAAPRPPAEGLAGDPATRERYASDWGLVRRRVPLAVARPESVDELAGLLARASAHRTPVAVRGRGQSAGGQSLAEGVVLSTERLAGVVHVGPGEVRVRAGLTWAALLRELAPRGLYPPVLTGWPPASVGGTLSAGGFSKGSHRHGLQIDHVASLLVVTGDGRRVACSAAQAGWLFEAALGGFGQFGVIAEATLRLAPGPPFVHVVKARVGADPAALLAALEAASADPATYHVTSFAEPAPTGAPGWVVVQALAGEREGPARAPALAPAGPPSAEPLADYVAPTRPERPPGPALWLHLFLPREGLGPFVAAAGGRLRLGEGDAMQAMPVRVGRARRASLLQGVEAAEGSLAYAVCLTREARGRELARLEAENYELYDVGRGLGGKSCLQGTLPRDEAEWRAHLGAAFDDALRAKRLADPAGVLGAGLGLPGAGE
ncbi:MAG TPA: FAD-binding protein [Polyangiaceae bacterium]|nr:FAD-binding protein [Polyangiaceae bacterium]